MVVVRELLSYLVLALTVMAAIAGIVGLQSGASSLLAAMADTGPLSAESQAAAARLASTSEPGVLWLILASVLLANFTLIRIWDGVVNL